MLRLIGIIATFALAGIAGCDSSGEVASPKKGTGAVIVQHKPSDEISVQAVLRDVVGRKVRVAVAGETAPGADWTFESKEPRQAQIIERHVQGDDAELVVLLSTSGAPGSDEEDIHLSGTLRLVYRRESGQWMLQRIDNITFRYAERIMI